MTRHEPQPQPARAFGDAGRQLAQLREVLRLVEAIAGRSGQAAEAALDEAALVAGAYGEALPIVQRRFDALVAETVAWAAAGVDALTRAGGPPPAAARLADEIERALEDLTQLLKV